MLYRAKEQYARPVVMTDRDLMFERHMQNFERNRMYPPGYGKEHGMIEPTMDHVNALCHAEFFYNAAISKLDGGRMRKAAEDDLLRLAELKLHIIQSLVNPQKQLNLEDSHYGDTDKP